MKIISWIVFIGLCIKAGAILISYLISLSSNEVASSNLYEGLDLSELYTFSKGHYSIFVIAMVLFSALKAYLFYYVVKIFSNFEIDKPFSFVISKLVLKISYISFIIGLAALIANAYNTYLISKNVVDRMHWPIQEYLFMAGIIFIIAMVFRRGIEIQQENELTI